jgi:hypothetical protein
MSSKEIISTFIITGACLLIPGCFGSNCETDTSLHVEEANELACWSIMCSFVNAGVASKEEFNEVFLECREDLSPSTACYSVDNCTFEECMPAWELTFENCGEELPEICREALFCGGRGPDEPATSPEGTLNSWQQALLNESAPLRGLLRKSSTNIEAPHPKDHTE